MVSRDGAVKAARGVLTLNGTTSIFGSRRHPFSLKNRTKAVSGVASAN